MQDRVNNAFVFFTRKKSKNEQVSQHPVTYKSTYSADLHAAEYVDLFF